MQARNKLHCTLLSLDAHMNTKKRMLLSLSAGRGHLKAHLQLGSEVTERKSSLNLFDYQQPFCPTRNQEESASTACFVCDFCLISREKVKQPRKGGKQGTPQLKLHYFRIAMTTTNAADDGIISLCPARSAHYIFCFNSLRLQMLSPCLSASHI